MEENRFFTTRPRMASELMTAGFIGKQVVNPYNPDRPAWSFTETAELLALVKELQGYSKIKGGEVK